MCLEELDESIDSQKQVENVLGICFVFIHFSILGRCGCGQCIAKLWLYYLMEIAFPLSDNIDLPGLLQNQLRHMQI